MVIIQDDAHFARVCAFAAKTHQAEPLFQTLLYLHYYADPTGDGTGCTVTLARDWAPASFRVRWTMLRGPFAPSVWGGGCIYHGNQAGWDDEGVYVSPFAVRITSHDDDSPWSIHT